MTTQKTLDPTAFVFNVEIDCNDEICIPFTLVTDWNTHQCWIDEDRSRPDELTDRLRALGIENAMEGLYEDTLGRSISNLKALLSQIGFIHEPELTSNVEEI